MNSRLILFSSLYLSLGSLLNLVYLVFLPYTILFDPKRILYLRIFYLYHRTIARLFWETQITGVPVKAIPRPCVFVVNHQTFLDNLHIYLTYPHLCRSMLKRGVRWYPVLGTMHMLLDNVFVDRSFRWSGKKAIQKSIRHLQNGISLILFPEGQRSRTEELLEFKIGSFKIACEAGVPVVPVRQEMRKIFDESKKSLSPGTFRCHVFKSIDTTNKTPDEVRELAFQQIQSKTL